MCKYIIKIHKVPKSTQETQRYTRYPKVLKIPKGTQGILRFTRYPKVHKVPKGTHCTQKYTRYPKVHKVPKGIKTKRYLIRVRFQKVPDKSMKVHSD